MPLVFGGQKQHLIWRRGRHFAEKAESSAAGNFKFIESFSDWIDRAEMTCCKLSDGLKKWVHKRDPSRILVASS